MAPSQGLLAFVCLCECFLSLVGRLGLSFGLWSLDKTLWITPTSLGMEWLLCVMGDVTICLSCLHEKWLWVISRAVDSKFFIISFGNMSCNVGSRVY